VNSVKDLRRALRDEFRTLETESQFDERMLDQARARRSLHLASVGHRSMKGLHRDASGSMRKGLGRSLGETKPNDPPRLMALLATMLAVVLVASFVLVARALHPTSNVPAHRGPRVLTQPGSIQVEPCRTGCDVATQAALQPLAPVTKQCVINGSDSCQVQSPFFASPSTGWITVAFMPNGPSTLYRTDDGAQHWRPVLSWAGATQNLIQSGPDRQDVLLVASIGSGAKGSIFHSSDGGAHWVSHGFPIGVIGIPILDFVNAEEGWVTAFTGLLHTTDGGAHWARVAKFGNGPEGGPDGGFFFFPSSIVVATSEGAIYASRDGANTWRELTPQRPKGLSHDAKLFNLEATFLSSQEAAVGYYYCSAPSCTSADLNYVYTTTDGGADWSDPVRLPATVEMTPTFIDTNHWFAMTAAVPATATMTDTSVGSLIRTDDGGRHWTVLVTASPGNHLPGWDLESPAGFTDPVHGWATTMTAGYVTSLRVTSDGGRTWVDRPLPDSAQTSRLLPGVY
jgi:photosystem II stability/assembly factor-like uncharacterized protein